MTAEIIGLGGLAALFGLLMLRAPIGVAMVAVGMGGVFALGLIHSHAPFLPYLKQYKTLLWNTVSNYELSVVPLFVLMGYLSANIGFSRDLFAGVYAVVGRWRGGVGMAAVGACAGFGAVCGSSLATASAMGRIALPELRQAHYQPGFAAGILAAGGTLGILIPPSVVLVIYAIVVEASIIKIFQAAIVPGVLAVLFFFAVIAVAVRLFPAVAGQMPPPSAAEKKTRHPARHTRFVNFWNRYFWFEHGDFHPHTGGGNRRCRRFALRAYCQTTNGRRFNIIAFRHRQNRRHDCLCAVWGGSAERFFFPLRFADRPVRMGDGSRYFAADRFIVGVAGICYFGLFHGFIFHDISGYAVFLAGLSGD